MLRQEKGYRQLFLAGLVNGIGDRFSQVASLSLILTLTGSGMAVGITFAVRLIPSLVFGPLGGMLADRFSRKKIMVLSDLIRAFVALSFLFVHDASDVWVIYVSSFLLSAGEAIYAPTRTSSIPILVPKERLLAVNGLEEHMVGLVLILGSITGGVVAAFLGTAFSFIVNAASFVLSAVLLGSIVFPAPHAQTKVKHDTDLECVSQTQSTRKELRAVWKSSRFVRAMIVGFTLWPIGYGVFNILLSVYAVQVYDQGDLGIGLMYGALGIGMVIGSSWTSRFMDKMKLAVVSGFILEGVLHMGMSQVPNFGLTILLLLISAIGSSIANACNHTLLMHAVPAHFQGRFFGLMSAMHNTFMGITMLSTGFLLEVMSPRVLGFFGGLVITAVSIGIAIIVLQDKSHPDCKNIEMFKIV
ncbi:MFS transporter [Paenibacillus selenitireducens]|uniref:MFS transporter n=2 Tax=Paenibacillus selenitireducens TaxID=1324314 RepID=A0A1T2XDF1_9BACL|nr:MFS transporter [Paenibacillus selenitireducens]